MSKFLYGHLLNAAVENILNDAQGNIVIVSPYIKIHEKYKPSLLKHLENDKLKLIVVFGKNEDDLAKSISTDDLDFFKQFRNVEIRHEKRLHAKYYANENKSIITSMNLYNYSQDHNIEVGVLMENKLLGGSLDQEAYEYFKDIIIKQSNLIFRKTPIYENSLGGLIKKYTGSTTEIDKTLDLFPKSSRTINSSPLLNGFCIRTGIEIPFNIEKPLSNEAYNSWKRYGDINYSEKYCHFSGEPSYGETSVARPIISKNWRKAKDVFGF